MEGRNGGEFHRKVKFGMVGNALKPVYVGQTLMDYDTGETLEYDSTMESSQIERLLKKYSDWFRKLFMATRSHYIDIIEHEKAQHGTDDGGGNGQ
jgi:hypothetical protein